MLLEDVRDGPPHDAQPGDEAKRPMMVCEARDRQLLMGVPGSSKSGTAEVVDTDGESLGCAEGVGCVWRCHEAEAVGVQPGVGNSSGEAFAVHRWWVAARAGLAVMEEHAEARTRTCLILPLLECEASKAK